MFPESWLSDRCGGVEDFLGGLIAILPGDRDPLRRRAQARYAARWRRSSRGRRRHGAGAADGGQGCSPAASGRGRRRGRRTIGSRSAAPPAAGDDARP